ncbi:deoxyguanosinetriphosphate triphosphohydrolase [Shewanella sp. OPT22]|nr:deoxyguanosinetriphosphate triphosphohydrolase [Shewanella sp. OPT22]
MKQKDNLKSNRIDRLEIRYHLILLLLPILLITVSFYFLAPLGEHNVIAISLTCLIYTIGYSLTYYLHQGRLNRLWQHLEHVININETTYELVSLSNQYKNQHAFLDALLKKAVTSINGAEMGSIILYDPETQKMRYEASLGMNNNLLKKVSFELKDSFQFRLTNGKCDRVVVINDMGLTNANSGLNKDDQQTLLSASSAPIHSTLSTPIHIDGQLYAMLNLDSSRINAFNDYDSNLVAILTQEACNAISLFQKNLEIYKLANFDQQTMLSNRQHFEQLLKHWRFKPHLPSFIIVMDMDNLKNINDSLGHQAGDTAILALANALKEKWQNESLIGRFGGDEFVVVTYGPLAKIKFELEQLQKDLIQGLGVQFSYGIAAFKQDWQSAFKDADSEMYLQKRAKKNSLKHEIYDQGFYS